MSNFVILTKQEFEEQCLPSGWGIVDDDVAKEIIYQFPTENKRLFVRIYSTVDKRSGVTRDIGTDAIRIVFWANNRAVGKGKRIHRVEGRTTIGSRIRARVQEFLADAKNQDIVDMNYVRAILEHDAVNWMELAQSLLEQLDERGSLSDSQIQYIIGTKNPKGKPTFEARVREKDPDFEYTEYDDEYEEESPKAEKKDKDYVSTSEPIHISTPPLPPPISCYGEEENPAEIEEAIEKPIGLVSTSEYKDFQYPFPSFNPVQSAVFPIRNEDVNIIISANTSSGKTICAELIMDNILASGKRVLYMSPLKSLTEEKRHDFGNRFSNYEIAIMTGDYVLNEQSKSMLAKSQILVLTSEMVDSRTRRMANEKNFWLKEVGAIIVDESHIISADRGAAVEVGLMRFSQINPLARIVFLSATMPNTRELANWLTVLNGKQTKVIASTWRPVELQFNYLEYPISGYYAADQKTKIQLAIDTVLLKPTEKFLIFVWDKNTGRNIVQELSRRGVNALFHNADLNLSERREIEDRFRDTKEGSLRVLVSTSTLAWGSIDEDSKILLANGNEKLAKQITIGDTIISFNLRSGCFEQDVVLSKTEYIPIEEIHIELDNGIKIISDRKHPFYTIRSDSELVEIEAQNIKVGDYLFNK